MPSRSVRCSSPRSASRVAAAALLGVTLFAARAALATMTVVPFNSPVVAAPDNVIYYPGFTTAPTGPMVADSVNGFGTYNLSQTAFTESSSFASAIQFTVSTTTTTQPSTGAYYLVITSAIQQGNPTTYPVAIAGSGGIACASAGCLIGPGIPPGSDPVTNYFYYYAAPWTNTTAPITVQLYPEDMCTTFNKQASSANAQGCYADPVAARAGYATAQPQTVGATAQPLVLTFALMALAPVNGVLPMPLPTAADSVSVSIKFESNDRTSQSGGAIACPAGNISYQPGDGQIIVDTSAFGPQAVPQVSGYAPITATILAGQANSNLSTTTLTFPTPEPTGYPGSFLYFGVTGLSTNETVGGFTNIQSTTDSADSYDVGFLLRDAAGLVYTPTATNFPGSSNKDGCILIGVQTSSIQGFLSKSSCFIATAAFRSIDASPVAMLRQFRDQVLLKTAWGTSFVHWYYHWSPPAAEWLMRHPQARWPVLEALVPVEVTAWFILHPVQLMLLGVLVAGALLTGVAFAFLMRAKRRTLE